jgi:hypothetical protein
VAIVLGSDHAAERPWVLRIDPSIDPPLLTVHSPSDSPGIGASAWGVPQGALDASWQRFPTSDHEGLDYSGVVLGSVAPTAAAVTFEAATDRRACEALLFDSPAYERRFFLIFDASLPGTVRAVDEQADTVGEQRLWPPAQVPAPTNLSFVGASEASVERWRLWASLDDGLLTTRLKTPDGGYGGSTAGFEPDQVRMLGGFQRDDGPVLWDGYAPREAARVQVECRDGKTVDASIIPSQEFDVVFFVAVLPAGSEPVAAWAQDSGAEVLGRHDFPT